MKRFLFLTLAVLGGVCHIPAAPAASSPMKAGDWDTYPDTWGATDGLGRTLPGHDATGDPRPDKQVAMFCFMSNDNPGARIIDLTQILAAAPDTRHFPGGTAWWGEPWLGYYVSSDPAVIRKHVQMLTDAGVDVMVYDNTNGYTYPNVREAICKVLTEMRAEGLKTPQIAFFCGSKAWDELYKNFYWKNLYPDLWFRWQGKPLILIHGEQMSRLDPEISSYFTVRPSWAWTNPGGWFGDGRDRWPWLDFAPQKIGWHDDPKTAEELSVCVAQHATTSIGRSYRNRKEPPLDQVDSAAGICFDEQWKIPLAVSPNLVFVTGWDEWTAGNFSAKENGTFAGHAMKIGESTYVDEYDEEFSRDIEPEKGKLQDNYYYQLIANVRRYKGTRAVPPVEPRPIKVDGHFEDWAEVQPEFRDNIGDTMHRDSPGWGDKHYVNQTGRNDLVAAKVSYDARNVYFYVRTRDAITPRTDPNWMLLYIDSNHDPKTGWMGYDFVVNRTDVGDGTTALQKNVGGKYQWETVGRVSYSCVGNEMELAIPRSLIGINASATELHFKWADNIQQTGDPSDFTLNGDAAPDDRFYYIAKLGVR